MSDVKRPNHVLAILALPFMATLVIPTLLLFAERGFSLRLGLLPTMPVLRVMLALIAVASGLWLFYATVRLFATVGQGTLAPWDATRRLVVEGVYRHVRNPMITGVALILFGEALLTQSFALGLWALLFTVVNLIYIPLVEERGLIARFGDTYRLYRQNVPRWIPRRTPWSPPATL